MFHLFNEPESDHIWKIDDFKPSFSRSRNVRVTSNNTIAKLIRFGFPKGKSQKAKGQKSQADLCDLYPFDSGLVQDYLPRFNLPSQRFLRSK